MSRINCCGDRARHKLPLPPGRYELLPFLIEGDRVIAPWLKQKPRPGDIERLGAVIGRVLTDGLPARVCWCWPDRDPEPVPAPSHAWLLAWQRDRAIYALAA